MLTETVIETLEKSRCAAMVDGDANALNRLLDERLIWAHASGKLDTKASFIKMFQDGSTQCFGVDTDDVAIRIFPNTAIITGIARLDALMNGVRKEINNRFTAVSVEYNEEIRLASWQSARL